MGKNSSVLLYGGGLDSTILAGWLAAQNITPVLLHFDYGQRASLLEREAQTRFGTLLGCKTAHMSLSFPTTSAIMKSSGDSMAEASSNVLEGRNLALISLAASYAWSIGSRTLYAGFHLEPEGSCFADAKPEFFKLVQSVLHISFSEPIEFRAPFITWPRQEIYNWAKKHNPVLTEAHTCYDNIPGGCGVCAHCSQKLHMDAQCVA